MSGMRIVSATIVLLALALSAGPRLTLALEDANDPAPRRFALTAQIAGQCAGLIISWSARAGRAR